MASPAASLGHPDSQQDTDFFGTFGSPSQPSARSAAASPQQAQRQQAAMDPFDLFGEGSTVPAQEAAAGGSQHPSADDGLFGDVEGHQGDANAARLVHCPAPTHNYTKLRSLRGSNLYTAHQGVWGGEGG